AKGPGEAAPAPEVRPRTAREGPRPARDGGRDGVLPPACKREIIRTPAPRLPPRRTPAVRQRQRRRRDPALRRGGGPGASAGHQGSAALTTCVLRGRPGVRPFRPPRARPGRRLGVPDGIRLPPGLPLGTPWWSASACGSGQLEALRASPPRFG